jgi:hypothetical protein
LDRVGINGVATTNEERITTKLKPYKELREEKEACEHGRLAITKFRAQREEKGC